MPLTPAESNSRDFQRTFVRLFGRRNWRKAIEQQLPPTRGASVVPASARRVDGVNIDEVRFRVDVERLGRWEDLRSLLGWRWKWTVWAWDDSPDERRWRPPAFTCPTDSLYYGLTFDGRGRSHSNATQGGEAHAAGIRRSMATRFNREQRITMKEL